MLPLYSDSEFTFRFADDRIIPRFHLEGVASGTPVVVYQLEPTTSQRLNCLTKAVVGEDGWVDLPEPIIVKAGDVFVAVCESKANTVNRIHLRPVQVSDLPRMFELQCDPESNRMAVMNPRTRESFDAHWAKTLADPQCLARAILLDNELVGLISCFPVENEDHIGYWIDRTFWGQGIANRALQLLLLEVTKRPLIATVATSNVASLRVLQKSGFVLEKIELAPARERYPECEEATLVLN